MSYSYATNALKGRTPYEYQMNIELVAGPVVNV